MAVTSKIFTTHKRGEKDEDNQDSVAVNPKIGRYALSDGVTKSFLPRLLSDLLTQTYVNADAAEEFPGRDLPAMFKERRDNFFSSLDDFGLMVQENAEELFHVGAATFAGITLHDGNVSWKVIGDTCLFILPDGGELQCICSNPVAKTDDGKVVVDFDNFPSQIHSDGHIIGKIITGTQSAVPGWYTLMSDAISAWFINRCNNGENVVERIMQLSSNEDFENFVEEEYKAERLKNDDCSVIIIRIDGDTAAIQPKDDAIQPEKDITDIDAYIPATEDKDTNTSMPMSLIKRAFEKMQSIFKTAEK